jgi:hypothetical protein
MGSVVVIVGPRLWKGLGLVALVLVVLGGCLAPVALAVGDANTASCPNGGTSGFQVSLPDCRAYEVVSRANSHDLANIIGSYGWPEGEHVYYTSFLPIPGGEPREGIAGRFLATRTPSEWVSAPVSPLQGGGPKTVTLGVQTHVEPVAFTSDFSQAFVSSPFHNPGESPLRDEANAVSVQRLSLTSPQVETLSLPDSGVLTQGMVGTPGCLALGFANGCGMFLGGASANGGRVFFQTEVMLSTAPGTPQPLSDEVGEIYERSGGHTYLVGVMPDGSVPACGANFAMPPGSTRQAQQGQLPGAVAPSGANVVFSASTCTESSLFLRDVVHGTTVPLPGGTFNARAGTGPGEEEKLITWGSEKLYEYHVATGRTVEIGADPGNTTSQGQMTDGDVLAYTPDGSYVWFLGPEDGVYRWHEGEAGPTPVPGTQLGGYTQTGSGSEETPGFGQAKANMPVSTPDGADLLFLDSTSLVPSFNSGGDLEAYVYDANNGKVTCISCNPAGAPEQTDEHGKGVRLVDENHVFVAEPRFVTPSPPFISDDGDRAVFETTEALVPQDTNGTEDVYEWSRVNTNGCTVGSPTHAAVDHGCLYLLSSGLGEEVPNTQGITDGTHLVGASENLKDVYMQSGEAFLPGLDNGVHVYDARVDGGFVPHTPSSPGCEAGRCQTAPGESVMIGEPMTETFVGAGNVKSHTTPRAPRLRGKRCRGMKSHRSRRRCERRPGHARRRAHR